MPEHRGHAAQFQRRNLRALARWRCGEGHLVAADHQPHHIGTRQAGERARFARIAAVAQHRDVAAEREHLLQLVADEEDADTLGRQPAQHAEQGAGLVQRQRGGRLVEYQEAAFQRQRLGDLDELHLRHTQARYGRAGVNVQRQQVEPPARGPRGRLGVEQAEARRWAFQRDVLGDRETGDQVALLVHGADARGDGVPGRSERDRPAVQQHLARVGLMHAGQQLDQRGLAGAVLAQERVGFDPARRPGSRSPAHARRRSSLRPLAPRRTGRSRQAHRRRRAEPRAAGSG